MDELIEKVKKLKPGLRQMYEKLKAKKKYWNKKKRLDVDGFFYCTDSELAKDLNVCKRSIRSYRNRLKELGLIDFKLRSGRGNSTSYGVWEKGEEFSSFNQCNRGRSFRPIGKNIPLQEGKNSTSYIESNTKEEKSNHIYLPDSFFKKIHEEFNKDCIKTKEYFMGEDYTEQQIQDARYRYEGEK